MWLNCQLLTVIVLWIVLVVASIVHSIKDNVFVPHVIKHSNHFVSVQDLLHSF